MLVDIGKGYQVQIDPFDAWVLEYKWYPQVRRYATYAQGLVDGSMVSMHRAILTRSGVNLSGLVVDHVDHNGLNNCRDNLRPCTQKENLRNLRARRASGLKGVQAHGTRWIARIKVDYRDIHLGLFDTPEEAARAYDCAALDHFGSFASINFPEDQR